MICEQIGKPILSQPKEGFIVPERIVGVESDGG
jgi:hypothetical protein